MSPQTRSIGVIGLGLLGSAIANRLLDHGFAVLGYDVDPVRAEKFRQLGGTPATDPKQLCDVSEAIVLSLPTSEVVAAVSRQIAPSLRVGTTILDTTTGDPQQMIAIGEFLAGHQTSYLEANVAGSSSQLREGTATVFLGGDGNVVASTKAILDAIAPARMHLGPIGSASRFKLVHNLVLGLHRAVLAEGLSFAESLGFSATDTLEILRQTPAASTVMETKGEKMVARDYGVQARLSQHLKDVRLILREAERAGSSVPLSESHRRLLERAEDLGFGDADNSAIMESYNSARIDAE